MPRALRLDALRRYAVARSLFAPTTLGDAIQRLGFVQADPIRSPARAQDLTLRHRVVDYRAGELERRYAELDVDEDHFVNYGFLPRAHLALMQPRVARRRWSASQRRLADEVLAFVREVTFAHPKRVQERFALGRTTNAWGGTSNAVTALMEGMHYRGMLRVKHREAGQRVYEPIDHAVDARSDVEKADAVLDLVIAKYAPLATRGLSMLVSALSRGAPQLQARGLLRAALARARTRLPHAEVDGDTWVWPVGEDPWSTAHTVDDEVRLLAPFDPIVWDRARFETFFGWAYRFEAYTPAEKRVRGYYALPLLHRDRVVGWANLRTEGGRLIADVGHASGRAPRDPSFRRALDAELDRMRVFLGLADDEDAQTTTALRAKAASPRRARSR